MQEWIRILVPWPKTNHSLVFFYFEFSLICVLVELSNFEDCLLVHIEELQALKILFFVVNPNLDLSDLSVVFCFNRWCHCFVVRFEYHLVAERKVEPVLGRMVPNLTDLQSPQRRNVKFLQLRIFGPFLNQVCAIQISAFLLGVIEAVHLVNIALLNWLCR